MYFGTLHFIFWLRPSLATASSLVSNTHLHTPAERCTSKLTSGLRGGTIFVSLAFQRQIGRHKEFLHYLARQNESSSSHSQSYSSSEKSPPSSSSELLSSNSSSSSSSSLSELSPKELASSNEYSLIGPDSKSRVAVAPSPLWR